MVSALFFASLGCYPDRILDGSSSTLRNGTDMNRAGV